MPLHIKLKFAREHAGLTQQDVANACGVKREAISQWESKKPENRTQPSIENLKTFVKLTGAKVNELLSDSEEIHFDKASSLQKTPSPNSVQVPMLSATLSMGDGILADLNHDDQIRSIELTKEWIKRRLSAASNIKNIRITRLGYIHRQHPRFEPLQRYNPRQRWVSGILNVLHQNSL